MLLAVRRRQHQLIVSFVDAHLVVVELPEPRRWPSQLVDVSRPTGINDEQRLLRHILAHYDRSVRPVFNASTVVIVFMGLTLTHIFNIVR